MKQSARPKTAPSTLEILAAKPFQEFALTQYLVLLPGKRSTVPGPGRALNSMPQHPALQSNAVTKHQIIPQWTRTTAYITPTRILEKLTIIRSTK